MCIEPLNGGGEIRNSVDHTKLRFDFPDKRPLVDSQPQVTTRFRNVNIETALCNVSIIKPVKVMMAFMVMTTLYWHTNLLKLGQRVKVLCLVILYDMYLWGGRRTWLSKTGKSISSHFISLTTWFLWLNLTRKQRPCMSRMGFLLLKKKGWTSAWYFVSGRTWFHSWGMTLECIKMQMNTRKVCKCWNFTLQMQNRWERAEKKAHKWFILLYSMCRHEEHRVFTHSSLVTVQTFVKNRSTDL